MTLDATGVCHKFDSPFNQQKQLKNQFTGLTIG